MCTHNICFRQEIRKILSGYPLLSVAMMNHLMICGIQFMFVVSLQGDTVDSEHLSEFTEEEHEISFARPNMKGFMKWDAKYLKPFFTRKFTQQVIIVS